MGSLKRHASCVKPKKSPVFEIYNVSDTGYENYLSKNGLNSDQGLLLSYLVRLMDGNHYENGRIGILYYDNRPANLYKIKLLLSTIFNFTIFREELRKAIDLFKSKKILVSIEGNLTAPFFFRRVV